MLLAQKFKINCKCLPYYYFLLLNNNKYYRNVKKIFYFHLLCFNSPHSILKGANHVLFHGNTKGKLSSRPFCCFEREELLISSQNQEIFPVSNSAQLSCFAIALMFGSILLIGVSVESRMFKLQNMEKMKYFQKKLWQKQTPRVYKNFPVFIHIETVGDSMLHL